MFLTNDAVVLASSQIRQQAHASGGGAARADRRGGLLRLHASQIALERCVEGEGVRGRVRGVGARSRLCA